MKILKGFDPSNLGHLKKPEGGNFLKRISRDV